MLKKCLVCENIFEGRIDRRTCSPKCKKRLERFKKQADNFKRVCPICSAIFIPKRKDQTTCNNACRQKLYRDRSITPMQILCAGGNKRYVEIGFMHGFMHGARLPNQSEHYASIFFADQNWKTPNLDAYLKSIKKYRPYLATVRDWESKKQFEEVMEWGKAISPFVRKIIIIPKVLQGIPRIPPTIGGKEVVLGYSIPTSHGGTTIPIEEFEGWPIHILGGSPQKQISIWKQLRKKSRVISCDGNYMLKLARNNQFWSPKAIKSAKNRFWPQLQEVGAGMITHDSNYEACRRTCESIKNSWQLLKNALDTSLCRYAEKEDIKQIKLIADDNRNHFGFIPQVAFEESLENKELLYHPAGAFCRFHRRRDGWCTVYELCVDDIVRQMGLGKFLLEQLPMPFRLKCPMDNIANEFYRHLGLNYKGSTAGKTSFLNIWERLQR